MSLGRKYRRAMERKLAKDRNPMVEIKRASEYVYDRLHENQVDEDTHNLVSAMYYLIGIVLHERYGFGQQRIMRVYEAIDERLAEWQDGSKEAADFRRILKDEVGIELAIQ